MRDIMCDAAMSNAAVTTTATGGPEAIEGFQFRTILGHYPTGVVVVTAIDEDGEPAGMTLGSFTSVSLDPPLIGFLPTRGSRTFSRLRAAKSFCVNVLAADQEWLCRRFASSAAEDKFAGVDWFESPSGAPVLHDVVAWIDCTLAGIAEAGDHYFVLGDVTDLRVVRPVQPLLFFQGGYGRFVPLSQATVRETEVITGTRLAEAARPAMQALALELGAECSAMTAAGRDLVVVATAVAPGLDTRGMVGRRIPLRPPLGELYVAWQGAEAAEAWLASAPHVDDKTRADYRLRLELARQRGWSMSLAGDAGARDDSGSGDTPHQRLYEALREYSGHELTPVRQRVIEQEITQVSRYYAPVALAPGERYDVHSLVAPVFGTDGEVLMVLRLSQLPRQAPAARIEHWVARLLEAARSLSAVGTPAPMAGGEL